MKKTILSLAIIAITSSVFAQNLTTTSATVAFDATTPIDALPKAENKTVIASLNKTTGAVLFEAAVNNFSFSNPKIQEHFNAANWMNSASFPKFTFSGKIDKLSKVKFAKDGVYKVTVSGNLTVKGVSKPVSTPATITVTGGKVSAATAFSIVLADYGITGAPIDGGKVAKEPKITVAASF
ncbi:MAG: YceI family protein [Chitinophagaceae bacterium]|nr:YceI family protein [Chitinophagaceae bacterium]